jgi:hypothetical protein
LRRSDIQALPGRTAELVRGQILSREVLKGFAAGLCDEGHQGPTSELVCWQVMSQEAGEVTRENVWKCVPRPAFASFSEEGGGLARIHIKGADEGLEHLEAKDRRQIGGRSLVATEREVLMGAFNVMKMRLVVEREQVGEGRSCSRRGRWAHVWLNDQACAKASVTDMTFPPHATHLLQQIDVSWSRSFKSLFSELLCYAREEPLRLAFRVRSSMSICCTAETGGCSHQLLIPGAFRRQAERILLRHDAVLTLVPIETRFLAALLRSLRDLPAGRAAPPFAPVRLTASQMA